MAALSAADRLKSPGQSYLATLDKFVCVGIFAVGIVGALTLVGWALNITALKSVLPGLATMKVLTACGFIISSVCLWLLHAAAPGTRAVHVARVLAAVVLAIGAFSLAEYLFDGRLGDVLFNPGRGGSFASGLAPMSPGTAIGFAVLGLALLVFKAGNQRLARYTNCLVLLPLLIATLAIFSYAFGVTALYKVGLYSSMALHTALSLFVLSLCIIAANADYGFAKIATSDTVGGMVARWLLPTLPLVLFVLGWLRLVGEEVGWYEFHFGLALMVLLSIAVAILAISWVATALHRTDLIRQEAEAETRALNASLERRVRERTEELVELSAELTEANRMLKRLSLRDPLTGLANRRHFDSYLQDQIILARRHRQPLALILCDVDAFKAYNDHYGHQAGDTCLKQVAKAVRSCCRRPADLAARYGGEEFAVILPDTDLRGAMQIGQAIQAAVTQLEIPHAASAVGSSVSISGGVASLRPGGGDAADDLIALADQALYRAKDSGRNRMMTLQDEIA